MRRPYLMVQWADGPVTVELQGRFTREVAAAVVALLRTAASHHVAEARPEAAS